MARYKHIDQSPRFLPVDLAAQLLPGTFEHAAHHRLQHAVDLSRFDARFRNDDTGASAYPIDGVKLPSHASKRRSGTRADFER